MIRVAVVDNHEVMRTGIAAQLAPVPDVEVVASVAAPAELDPALGIDLVLLDVWLSGQVSSIDSIPSLMADGMLVLLYTSEEKPVQLRRAVELGASGVLLKDDPAETVVEGIRDAVAGTFCCSGPLAHALLTDRDAVADLAPRQVEILQALSDGLDYRGVARLLGCSEGTVKTHLARARDRFRGIGLEPGNALHLVRLATDQGHLH